MSDFDDWNILKKDINDNNKQTPYFKEGEIWWCSIGKNIEIESDGKSKQFSRPALIIKKHNNQHCLIIPTTTKQKIGKFYFKIKISNKKACLVLSQIKTMDSKRLLKRIGSVGPEKLNEIKKAAVKVNF